MKFDQVRPFGTALDLVDDVLKFHTLNAGMIGSILWEVLRIDKENWIHASMEITLGIFY